MIVALLGRQPELGYTELARMYDVSTVRMFGREAVLIESDSFEIQKVGGTLKAGFVHSTIPSSWQDVRRAALAQLQDLCNGIDQKITVGISAYGLSAKPQELQKILLDLKRTQKSLGRSVRIIPNQTIALNTATSHHNKLGLSSHKIELLLISDGNDTVIASSIGAQNITALARRDQGRPARDAFVGMLPPKLALMMVNMAAGTHQNLQILDPFCGTGVILQEALLRGHSVIGTDLNPKMVEYTQKNLDWLTHTHHSVGTIVDIAQADATTHRWPSQDKIDAIACETYLGQPFSATPSPAKLREVRGNCNHIIEQFLKNIHSQLKPHTTLCIAIPAWRDLKTGHVTRLPLMHGIEALGFALENTRPLLYFREDQVVARDILILTTAKR